MKTGGAGCRCRETGRPQDRSRSTRLDAEEIADLLRGAAAIAGALAGQPEAEAACAEHAPGWDGLADLHFALAIAAAGLDEAIEEHTGLLHP